jgi:hypothetical protein
VDLVLRNHCFVQIKELHSQLQVYTELPWELLQLSPGFQFRI